MAEVAKLISGSLLIICHSVGPALADASGLNSVNIDGLQIAQTYSESSGDAAGSKTTKSEKHADHDDHPLFLYSYEITASDDDNIRRAQNSEDIREDGSISLKLKARGGTPLSRTSMLAYGGSLTYQAFDAFDDLNNLSFEANAKYRFAGSARYGAPIYSLQVKLGGIDSESEMRDSTTMSLSFDVNKRMTTAVTLTAGLGVNSRESKSEVFDTSESRAFVNLDLNLSKASLVYTTYSFITGDIVSSATPGLEFINAADVIEPDDAFGGIETNQFAYRLDADTQVLTLGYNHILSRSLSIDLSYQYIDSDAVDNIEYERNILNASLLGRF